MEEVERRRDSKLSIKKGGESDQQQLLRVKKKALQTVLEQCQTALELLRSTDDDVDLVGNDDEQIEEEICEGSCSGSGDSETDELCNLLKSGVDSPDFLEKLGSVHVLVPQSNAAEEGNSWDVVSEKDLWEGGNMESDQESYVLVRQEDIMEGIACYTAAYLLSLQQTKELTPNQLQEALSKTFSVKKRKGKLQKVWDGSKVIYNVASWGATAIGIYQNPALLKAASSAFWTSCHVISKLF